MNAQGKQMPTFAEHAPAGSVPIVVFTQLKKPSQMVLHAPPTPSAAFTHADAPVGHAASVQHWTLPSSLVHAPVSVTHEMSASLKHVSHVPAGAVVSASMHAWIAVPVLAPSTQVAVAAVQLTAVGFGQPSAGHVGDTGKHTSEGVHALAVTHET